MIDYTGLRNTIVQGLQEHLGVKVVQANQNAPKPSFPFVTYTPTVPMSSLQVHTGLYVANEVSPEITERKGWTSVTFSITACAYQDLDEATSLALSTARWFVWEGFLYLKAANIVVTHLEEMGNRDTWIVDDYERRVGFDVHFRVLTHTSLEVGWIELVEVEPE